MREITRKQEKFIDEYLIDRNGMQAAIRAGFSKKTAKQIGCRLLTKAYIKLEIERRIKKVSEAAEVTAESIVRRLNLIADRCIQEVDPILKANGIYKRDRNTGKICFDFDATGASRALELLGKTKGMFIEKQDVTVGGRMIIVRPKR